MTLDRLFPRVIDHDYRGPKAASWILGFLAAVKMAMGLNSVLNGERVLTTADGVPLSAYPAAASQTIVALFALWGWALCLFALLAFATLVRYRSMTTLAFALLLVEHLGRKAILQFLPIARSDAAPASWINTLLLAVTIGGLALSLWRRSGGLVGRR